MSRRVAGFGVLIALTTGAGVLAVMVLGLTTPQGGAVARSASSGASASTSYPVEADYCFVEAMIPHHEQALELSALVLSAPEARERTRALAEFIEKDQSTEIETMQRWQDAWAQTVPTAAGSQTSSHGGHDQVELAASADLARGCGTHTDHTAMKGMATPEQLEALAAMAPADGLAADRLFLELMIVHHEGALEMATLAVQEGSNAYVRSSAKHVLIEQAREIAAMTALLAELP